MTTWKAFYGFILGCMSMGRSHRIVHPIGSAIFDAIAFSASLAMDALESSRYGIASVVMLINLWLKLLF